VYILKNIQPLPSSVVSWRVW